MAIYGAGSKWNRTIEKKHDFFSEGKFILGWNDENAKDLYEAISALKAGDIIYLKSNKPGSRKINVKGIGIVEKTVIQCLLDNEYPEKVNNWESFFIKVKWVVKKSFPINIEKDEGRLTNIRAASFYEEFLPSVQRKIIDKLLNTD